MTNLNQPFKGVVLNENNEIFFTLAYSSLMLRKRIIKVNKKVQRLRYAGDLILHFRKKGMGFLSTFALATTQSLELPMYELIKRPIGCINKELEDLLPSCNLSLFVALYFCYEYIIPIA